jgi:flagellar hook-associated protein 1 FlgK
MSVSTFTGIQTSLRALLAQQRALDVTSHNVANASTVGYSRQEALLAAADPLTIAAGGATGAAAQLGTGVDVVAYQRVRDSFLDLQYRRQNMSLGEETARSDSLSQVELALAEPGENGIATALSNFWNAWSTLSNSPESAAAKQSLLDKSRTLAEAINGLQVTFSEARTEANDELASLTASGGEVARITNDLKDTLNAIRDAEKTGAKPNDLYDRRDLLLDSLSTLGQVSVTASPAGGDDIALGGVTIIDSDDTTGIAAVPAGTFPLTFTANPGGQLGALMTLTSAGGPLAAYQNDLNVMAATLEDRVNTAYAPTGMAFFTYTAGPGGLPVLALNEPAVSVSTVRAGVAGTADNTIALEMNKLRGGDADKLYQQLVTRIGNEVSEASRRQVTAQVLTDALQGRRDSVSGVSLDEEMTNIIRFQRAYQAASRAMSTTDDMLDTLINRTGRVGL